MGTFGTGPFDNDGALDLLDQLVDQPAGQRRVILEQIFFQVRDRPDLLGWRFFPDTILAAAAVVVASLPGGEHVREDLADLGYAPEAILVLSPDHELTALAWDALLLVAGPDGPWHDGWADPQAAAEARRTTHQLAAVFFRDRHSGEQELPFES
jgi:alpha-glucosidase